MEETRQEQQQSAPAPAVKAPSGKNAHSALYVTLAVLVVLFLFAQFQLVQLNAKVDIITAMGTADLGGTNDIPTTADDSDAKSDNTDGVVTIEEFSDFQCPACKIAEPIINQLKAEYGDKIEFVYKHFPLSFHQNAQKAGEAYECALDQGKEVELHDLMFQNQNALSVSNLKGYASQLGIDSDEFDACLDSGEKASIVQADFAEGQRKGVTGTPAFFIEGEKLIGAQPIEVFRPIIDKYLA